MTARTAGMRVPTAFHHQKVTGAERAVQPIGIAKAARKVAPQVPDAVFEDAQTLLMPGLVPLKDHGWERSKMGGSTVLSAVNIHAIARERAFASFGSSPAWVCAIWKTIAPRLEQGEIAFFLEWRVLALSLGDGDCAAPVRR